MTVFFGCFLHGDLWLAFVNASHLQEKIPLELSVKKFIISSWSSVKSLYAVYCTCVTIPLIVLRFSLFAPNGYESSLVGVFNWNPKAYAFHAGTDTDL
jgi:hypothetical protein